MRTKAVGYLVLDRNDGRPRQAAAENAMRSYAKANGLDLAKTLVFRRHGGEQIEALIEAVHRTGAGAVVAPDESHLGGSVAIRSVLDLCPVHAVTTRAVYTARPRTEAR